MKTRSKLTAGCALVMCCALATANPDNIRISSDKAAFSEGRGTYEGNVQLNRGDLQIKSQQLVVTSAKGAVNLVVASGTPATFTDAGVDPVTASARSIEYRPADEALILIGNARVERQDSSIAGERIVYDSRSNVVRAESAGADDSRVNMVLQPAAKTAIDRKPNGNAASE